MNRLARKPERYRDENGIPCLKLRLARGQGHAFIDVESFERLGANGISPQWNLNAKGGWAYVKSSHPERGTVTISREVLGLQKGSGFRARHRNGNLRDLRASNLFAEPRSAPRPRPHGLDGRLLERGVQRLARVGPVPRPTKPWAFRDEHGRRCFRVRLGRNEKEFAIIDADDYQRMIAGGLGVHWQAVSNGYGRKYVYAKHRERGTVSVAREVLELDKWDERRVNYGNDNPFDLRRGNLLIAHPGMRRTRTQRRPPTDTQTSP